MKHHLLRLKREHLGALTTDELTDVVGGGITPGCETFTCPSLSCEYCVVVNTVTCGVTASNICTALCDR